MTYCDREKIRVAICQAQMEHDRETGDPCRKACSFCGPATDKVIAALEPARAMPTLSAAEIVAKAMWPKLFSESHLEAHRAASPMTLEHAREQKLRLVRLGLSALAPVPVENKTAPAAEQTCPICHYRVDPKSGPCERQLLPGNACPMPHSASEVSDQKILTLTEAEANAKEAVQAFLDAADLNLSMWEAVDGAAPNGASAIYERAKAANAALSTEPVPSRLMPTPEIEAVERERDDLNHKLTTMFSRALEAESRLTDTQLALCRYAKHDMLCPQTRFAGVMSQQPCTCGLSETLNKLTQTNKPVPSQSMLTPGEGGPR